MSYQVTTSNGDVYNRYTLKERYAYHKDMANTGKRKDGSKMTFTERNNHAESARRCQNKLGKFVRTSQRMARCK